MSILWHMTDHKQIPRIHGDRGMKRKQSMAKECGQTSVYTKPSALDPEMSEVAEYVAERLLNWDQRQRRYERGKYWLIPLTTGNGMLEIIEALAKQSWRFSSYSDEKYGYLARFSRGEVSEHEDSLEIIQRGGVTLPEATIRAAYAVSSTTDEQIPSS